MVDHQYQDLPEGLSLDSVIRIGHVVTTVRTFIKHGMVRQENGRFYKTFGRETVSNNPTGKPNPFSLKELQKRGFKVIAGNTEKDDLVMILPGSYCRIPDALRNGLLTETTKPI